MNAAAIADELDALRERHRRNLPRHNNPDVFHEEKSEIDRALQAIAQQLRFGPLER